jgi:hypothetical protein
MDQPAKNPVTAIVPALGWDGLEISRAKTGVF